MWTKLGNKDLFMRARIATVSWSFVRNGNVFLLQVVDTNNHVLYKKQDAQKGKFAFTTDDYDMFEVCFESEGQ